ncbi:Fic family protein [Endozoicomonas lisbonensis]|uniref:Fido domain-containing protein n=1 Tax=Endozoicomonas lisbonensis TaxID=3120522 RepID=A0ABV2SHG1_9GAMM
MQSLESTSPNSIYAGTLENTQPEKKSGAAPLDVQTVYLPGQSSPYEYPEIKSRAVAIETDCSLNHDKHFNAIWNAILNGFSNSEFTGVRIYRNQNIPTIMVKSHERESLKSLSQPLTALTEDKDIPIKHKHEILNLIYEEIEKHQDFNKSQKRFLKNLINDVKIYQSIHFDFNKMLEKSSTKEDENLFLHKLFIERDRAVDEKGNEFGGFVFEDEPSFLNKTSLCFMSLLNCIISKKKITYKELRIAASILYSVESTPGNYYDLVPKEGSLESIKDFLEGGEVIDMVTNNYYFRESVKFTDFMDRMFNQELGLSYCGIRRTKNTINKKYAISDKTIDELQRSGNKMYDFKMKDEDNGFWSLMSNKKLYVFLVNYYPKCYKVGKIPLSISVVVKKPFSEHKPDIVNLLLKNYYEDIKSEDSSLEKITKVINLCCSIQRLHPFMDGNGRSCFAALVPALLFERGLLLHQTIKDPWSMIDTCKPSRIAAEFLPYCTDAPVLTEAIDLQPYLSNEQKLILACAEGDIEGVKFIFDNYPHLDQPEVQIIPWKKLNLLKWSKDHGQNEVYNFLKERYRPAGGCRPGCKIQ